MLQGQVIVPPTDLVQQRLVHVGDRVRVEIDLECRTISYAVNDEALQIVFSKVALSRFINAFNRRYGFGFANCDQLHTISASLDPFGGFGESASDLRYVLM